MPIYEFICKDCGKVFEKLVLTKDEEKENLCPFCNSENTEKIISSFCSLKDSSSFVGNSCIGSGFGFS